MQHNSLLKKALMVAGAALLLSTTAEARNIKVGHFGSPNTPFNSGVEFFVKKLSEVSGGDLTATNFPSGQLGNEAQQIGALQGGLQEILITSSTNLIKYNKSFQLIDIPFAFPSDEATDKVLLGPVGKKMLAGLNGTGMVGLTYIDNGFRDLSNSKHPIAKLEDFKGLTFRVLGAPVFIDTFKALGTNPVPMPFPEVYAALETGTVDGQDNPLLTVRDQKFYEVQKYLTHSKHAYSALVMLVSEPFWKSLSDKQRTEIQEAADATALENRKLMRAAVEEAKTFLGTEGKMEVVDGFSPEALPAIKAAVEPVVKSMVSDDLKPLYDEMQAAIEAK